MNPRTLVAIGCLGLLSTSCAEGVAPRADRGLGVASMQADSDFRWSGATAAEVKGGGPVVDPRASEASRALGQREYATVLALTEKPSTAPTGAWLDYYRGAALAGLGRTDEAVEAFKRAALRFRTASIAAEDSTRLGERARTLYQAGAEQGRTVSLWGRARALYEAGRCAEARSAYEEYAAFVRLSDPRGAEMAAAQAGACKTPAVLR